MGADRADLRKGPGLAAYFGDNRASLDIPAHSYGIRYGNGVFRQRIDNGWPATLPETWLARGKALEIEQRDSCYRIGSLCGIALNSETEKWILAKAR